MLAGGSVFDHLDYSFTVGHEDGSDTEPNGPGGGSPEFRRRLKILIEFMRALPLLEMAPDFQTVKHAGGVITHMLSSPKGEYAMYVDGSGPTEITVNLPAGEYVLSWVSVDGTNPGAKTSFRHSGGTKTLETPACKNGIAMRMARTK